MRILFVLVIAYSIGCVFLKDSYEKDEDLKNYFFEGILSNTPGNIYYERIGQRSRRHVNNKKMLQRSHAPKLSWNRTYRGRNVASHDIRDKHLQIASKVARRHGSHPHRKLKAAASENSDEHEDFLHWDDWGDWTKCSVTCGNGRRVRWRHCSSEKCTIKGLKRAQMKTCHLEDCPTKGLLSWLGIKNKNRIE